MRGRFTCVFGNVLTELQNKDLSVLNLECPLTAKKTPIHKSGHYHKADPKTVECIKASGFDIVNLANNHITDYGPLAINETATLLRSEGIEHVGAASSLHIAQKPLYVQSKGRSIAFLAFAEHEFNWADERKAGAWPLDPLTNISQIKKAKTAAKIVIVLVHGGNEYSPIPSPRIVKTYRAFVEAGASAVIGMHPHVPQGYEIFKGSPIFYSLGNFVFDLERNSSRHALWSKSYAIRLHLQEDRVHQIETIPYRALASTGCLTLLKNRELDEFLRYVDFLSNILKDEREMEKYWNAWCSLMGPKWLRRLAMLSPLTLSYAAFKSNHFGRITPFLAARNMFVCESHSELLATFLDLSTKQQLDTAKAYIPFIKSLQNGEIPGMKRDT